MDAVFLYLAIGGSIVFVIKLATMFLGLGDGGDGDLDLDVDADADAGDSTGDFNLLSLQSLATLAMGTGWMGLTARGTFGFGPVLSLATGLAFGLALVWIMARLLSAARGLESSGNLDLHEALGQSGTVYLRIPAGGTGQVQLVVQGRLVTLEARAGDFEIPTGARVQVEGVDAGGALLVTPA